MKYMLLVYNCDRPEPGDPRFEEALARVNAFADECRRRGALVSGDALLGEHTATTVSVRNGRTLGSIEVRPLVRVPGVDHTPARTSAAAE